MSAEQKTPELPGFEEMPPVPNIDEQLHQIDESDIAEALAPEDTK